MCHKMETFFFGEREIKSENSKVKMKYHIQHIHTIYVHENATWQREQFLFFCSFKAVMMRMKK